MRMNFAAMKRLSPLAASLADWSYETTKNLTDERWRKMLYCERERRQEEPTVLRCISVTSRPIR